MRSRATNGTGRKHRPADFLGLGPIRGMDFNQWFAGLNRVPDLAPEYESDRRVHPSADLLTTGAELDSEQPDPERINLADPAGCRRGWSGSV